MCIIRNLGYNFAILDILVIILLILLELHLYISKQFFRILTNDYGIHKYCECRCTLKHMLDLVNVIVSFMKEPFIIYFGNARAINVRTIFHGCRWPL
jgi:hypothetical protein